MLESSHVPNWRVVLWVKAIEMICQLRPKAVFRLLAHRDRIFRAGMRWYSNIGRRVWIFEVWQWLFHDRRTSHGPTLAQFLKGGWKVEGELRRSWSSDGDSLPLGPVGEAEATHGRIVQTSSL